MSRVIFLLVIGLSFGMAHADEPNLGTLPAGSISTSEMSGVQAEICRDHLFDPASAHFKLPSGYRLRWAEEVAASDETIATFLKSNPTAKSYAVGSLCLMSFSTFIIDGKPVNTSGTMPAAFWWAAAEGPLHSDMRGKARWVQIGSWYPDDTGHSQLILRTDPMAQFTKIEVKQASPGNWHVSLVLPSETVVADIHATSPGVPRERKGPGYMSVPMSGESAKYFSVFTYAGHLIHDAKGEWRATGNGTFAAAFSIPDEASTFGTQFQSGWTSRSGLYEFALRQ